MWWYIAVFAVALIGIAKNMPSPQNAPPPGLGDIKLPTAQDGRTVPVLFGTKIIEGPNFAWYGDLRTVAIKKKGGKK